MLSPEKKAPYVDVVQPAIVGCLMMMLKPKNSFSHDRRKHQKPEKLINKENKKEKTNTSKSQQKSLSIHRKKKIVNIDVRSMEGYWRVRVGW